MYHPIASVASLPGYKLLITFDSQDVRLMDMKPYLDLPLFSELRDKPLFKTVHPCYDCIEWANEANIDARFIYSESVPYTK